MPHGAPIDFARVGVLLDLERGDAVEDWALVPSLVLASHAVAALRAERFPREATDLEPLVPVGRRVDLSETLRLIVHCLLARLGRVLDLNYVRLVAVVEQQPVIGLPVESDVGDAGQHADDGIALLRFGRGVAHHVVDDRLRRRRRRLCALERGHDDLSYAYLVSCEPWHAIRAAQWLPCLLHWLGDAGRAPLVRRDPAVRVGLRRRCGRGRRLLRRR